MARAATLTRSRRKEGQRLAAVRAARRVAGEAERLTRKDVARLTGVPEWQLGRVALGSLVGTLALDDIWEGKE